MYLHLEGVSYSNSKAITKATDLHYAEPKKISLHLLGCVFFFFFIVNLNIIHQKSFQEAQMLI